MVDVFGECINGGSLGCLPMQGGFSTELPVGEGLHLKHGKKGCLLHEGAKAGRGGMLGESDCDGDGAGAGAGAGDGLGDKSEILCCRYEDS